MKNLILMMFVFWGINSFAQTTDNSILGKWTNEDKTRVIEFVKNGNAYDAIVRSAEDKSLIGKKQISGLTQKDATSFVNGTVYIFKRNRTAKCSANLNGKFLQLQASMGLMSKSQTWTRL